MTILQFSNIEKFYVLLGSDNHFAVLQHQWNLNTVKPVHNENPWDPKIVAVVDMWSLSQKLKIRIQWWKLIEMFSLAQALLFICD